MIDIALEVVRALVLLGIVIFLWTVGRGRFELARSGWNFIIGGFGLLLFGSLVDITDNFEYLNRFVVIGNTETEAILEKFVGFLGGFVFLAIGLVRWISSVKNMSDEFTEGKRATEALRDQAEANDLLRFIVTTANETFDPDQVMKVCLDAVCAYTGWPVGHVYEFTGDGAGELRSTKIWHLDNPERFQVFRQVTESASFQPGIGLPGRVLASGEPAWIVDVTKDPTFLRAKMASDIGVKAAMAFPVLVGIEVVAVLEFFSEDASEPDPQILNILAQVGIPLGRAIERKRAEMSLREVTERFRIVVNNSPAKIHIKDKDGRYLLINRQAEKLFGVTDEDARGKTAHEIFGDKQAEAFKAHDKAVMESGRTVEDEEEWLEDGEIHTYLTVKFPIRDGDGKVTGVAAIGTDITERKQSEDALRAAHSTLEQRVRERTSELEKENSERKRAEETLLASEHNLQQRVVDLEEAHHKLEKQGETLTRLADDMLIARDQAEAASRAKAEFLATMSHEIRTPMNGVLGMIGLLLGTDLTAEQEKFATAGQSSARGLMTLINDILDVSKLEAGKLDLENVNFNLEQEFDHIASLVGLRARDKGIEVRMELDPKIPGWLNADCGRLRQIVLNLVGNAIKFTEQGSVTISASHRMLGEEICQLRCEVRDTGIGISAEVQQKLFTRFTQADSSTSRKYGGTGLGLSISKQLVELMGGRLGIDSAPGEGSTFWFTIQCGLGAPLEGVETNQEDQATARIGPLRILVAEDNQINQLLITKVLGKAGHHAEVVGNGLEAVQSVQSTTYDLVLMDVQMPEMDGMTATRKIRELPGPAGDIPIVALTANAMAGDREKYLASGMNDYVSKPIQHNMLFAAIARAVGSAGFAQVDANLAGLESWDDSDDATANGAADTAESLKHAIGDIALSGAPDEDASGDATRIGPPLSTEKQLVLAIESLSEHVVLFDAEDRILLANKAWREMNKEIIEFTNPGIRFEDHLRALVDTGLVPEALGRKEAWLRERMERHLNPDGPFEVSRQDGRWIRIHEQHLPNNGTILVISDITKSKLAAQALQKSEGTLRRRLADLETAHRKLEIQGADLVRLADDMLIARDQAEAANRTKAEFLANMSHEIRTPMNGIMGTIDLLLGTDLTKEQKKFVTVGQNSARGLLTLINDILDVSKLEAGKLALENVNFNLEQELDHIVSLAGPRARDKGIEVRTEFDPKIPEWLNADCGRFRQIVHNLVGNAIKFTEQGSVSVAASHRMLGEDLCQLRVEIRDTGIGIPADVQEKLFTRFTQADSSTSRKYGGTGLGLSICKQLVELMGGKLGVDSVPGKGSTFWFTIRCGLDATLDGAEGQEDQTTAQIGPLRILVAEDNQVNQWLIAEVLNKAGHQVEVVENGLQAVQSVQSASFDLVLMDVQMPEMDGPAATRKIRQLPGPVGDIPIIALTANAMVGDREMYLESGMNEYVSKPIQVKPLFAAIARVVGQTDFAQVAEELADLGPGGGGNGETGGAEADVLQSLEQEFGSVAPSGTPEKPQKSHTQIKRSSRS